MKTETKTALDSARQELDSNHAAQQAELDRKFAVLEMLPAGQIPIVCNWRTPSPIEPRVWICYSAPAYDPENKFDAVALLRSIEASGWKLIPEAALVKWDNYRPGMEPSAVATVAALPEGQTGSYRKYTDGNAVAPYWVLPCQHTKPDFVCFMLAPDGLTYRVSVDVPQIGVSISAQVQSEGSHSNAWHYVRGTGRLHTPKHWPLVSSHSKCWVDTEQGISGAAYFHADSAHKSAADALQFLLSNS